MLHLAGIESNFSFSMVDIYRSGSKIPEEDEKKALNKIDIPPLLQCTHHMCRVRVHWHVKFNYHDYWRAKIAIINFDYRHNYSQWTLVAQHPNLNNITQVYSFEYKPVLPYESISKFLVKKNCLLSCVIAP